MTDLGLAVELPPTSAELGSPLWWLHTLLGRMRTRQPGLKTALDYYDGDQPLSFASPRFKEKFSWLFKSFACNWCQLVVNAVEERMAVTGIRTLAPGEGGTFETNEAAWRLWQHNDLDAQSSVAHIEALLYGESYVTVWDGDDGQPEITVESPWTSIVHYDVRRPRRRYAGLRMHVDEWGVLRAQLFLPESVWLWRNTQPGVGFGGWEADPDVPGAIDGEIPNPYGVVPMVPLRNQPKAGIPKRYYEDDVTVRSELTVVRPLQDLVNKFMVDLAVASEFQSYRQRWATGMELRELRDEAGNVLVGPDGSPAYEEPFHGGADRVWVQENPESRFGDFAQADLAQFIKVHEFLVNVVAALSQTPAHYLNAQADRLSGESLKASEAGLVAKIRKRQTTFGDGWEQVMRLTGLIADMPELAADDGSEIVWADPEQRTEAEAADAALKRKDVGVPVQQLWADLGYSPQAIQSFEAMRARNVLIDALGMPAVTAVPAATAPTIP